LIYSIFNWNLTIGKPNFGCVFFVHTYALMWLMHSWIKLTLFVGLEDPYVLYTKKQGESVQNENNKCAN